MGLSTRLKRVSIRAWLVAAGLLLGLAVALVVWEWGSGATVIVDWPLEERQGAALHVGKRPIKFSGDSKLRIEGRPGTWPLHLEREGFEPIEKKLVLHRGEHMEFVPQWRPTPRTLRRNRLLAIEARATGIASLDVLSPTAATLRADLLAFLRDFPTGQEARAARDLAARLHWPLDLLEGTEISRDETPLPENAILETSRLTRVGLFGDSRLKFWNTITAIAASNDGRLLAGASRDGTVQVFDRTDGSRRHGIIPLVTPTELAFSPQGTTLAIAGKTGPVTLWNAATGALSATLHDASEPIIFSPDGSLIAVCAARQEIALWDAASGELRRTMPGHTTGLLRGLTFSHGGKMLASFGSDSSVLLWDVASGQQRRRFLNAQSPLFSPDDAFLAAGATNGDLILWDTRTGETQRTFDEGGYPLAFAPRGDALVSKRLGRAIVWNLTTGDETRTIVDVPERAAVSPDGKWLAGGDDTFGELRLWNLQQGASLRSLKTIGPVTSLGFTTDSSTIVAGTRDHVVQIFAAEVGAERTPADPPLGPADLSPDGQLLAARRGNRIELIEVATGATRRTLAGDVADLEWLAFSPDGQHIAGFGGWGFFGTSLRMWDSRDGRELVLEGSPTGSVRTIAFSPDGQLLASAGDSRLVTIWNVAKEAAEQTLDDFAERVTAIAFHPDGRRLAVACLDQTIVLWDLKSDTGKPLAKQKGVCRLRAFNNDGKLLAGISDDRVLVWHLSGGDVPAELATGDGAATSLAFDPVGQRLIAAGNEGLVWQWNDPARERHREEPDHVFRVGPPHGVLKRILWSPEGRHVVSVNGNGTIYVLRLLGK